jgi:integrase
VLIDLRVQKPLWVTLEALVAKRGGAAHQRSRRSVLKRFARLAGPRLGANAKVVELERLDWQALRLEYSPAYWNHLRRAIGALLAELLEGPEHRFRKAVMAKIERAKEPERDVDITVEQFWALVGGMPDVAKPCVVTLGVTAMRLGEYYACTVESKREGSKSVYCPGSKNADATGIIPVSADLWDWVAAGIPAPLSQQRLRHWFHAAAVAVGLGRYKPTGKTKRVIERRDRDGAPAKGERTGDKLIEVPATRYRGVTLHDLRHLALQLALDGGAQLNDVQSLARHADPAMTMRYLKRAGRKRAAEAIGRSLKIEEA